MSVILQKQKKYFIHTCVPKYVVLLDNIRWQYIIVLARHGVISVTKILVSGLLLRYLQRDSVCELVVKKVNNTNTHPLTIIQVLVINLNLYTE